MGCCMSGNTEEEFNQSNGWEKEWYEIANNGKSVTLVQGGFASIFGSKWIESTKPSIYIWTLKIDKFKEYEGDMGIGIATNDKLEENNGRWYKEENDLSFVFFADGEIRTNTSDYMKYASEGFKAGSIVEMKLDLYTQTLSFKVDGNDKGIAFKDIESKKGIKYKMAVYMLNASDSISLVSFICE
eukprot:390349_1